MNSEKKTEPHIIKGKEFAEKYAEKILKPRCNEFKKKFNRLPKLATIMVGEDPASESYLKIKEKYFAKLCLESQIYRYEKNIQEGELLKIIKKMNKKKEIDGILIQLPLPEHIDKNTVIETIAPEKDVEGLSPFNVYAWAKSTPNLVPATALGVLALLKHHQIPLEGKHAVIIGRSMIVGKPLFHLLLKENCTVTICHSRSKPLEYFTVQADILVAAAGKAHLVKADMVKKNAIVVDVGVNFIDGKLLGDVDFQNVKEKTKLITPVPGGTGPVTVAMLAGNLLLTAELQKAKDNKEQTSCLYEYYENYEMVSNIDFC